MGRLPVWILSAMAAASLTLGCAAHKPPATNEAVASTPAPASTPARPTARVDISYAQPDDYLQSLTVTKYSGARLLLVRQRGANRTSSIIRFEGGEPIWEIRADTGVGLSLLEHVPGVQPAQRFALKSATYGRVPSDFIQVSPDSGLPEPLEANNYYVFSVTRASGIRSFQVAKAGADGVLRSYEAEPHAGTSFELCCNIPPSFASLNDEPGALGAP